MKLLIATHNKAKLQEIRTGLHELIAKGVELCSLADLSVTVEPEETGETIQENAELKARFYGEKTGMPTLADDSGFFIDALNGEPGVLSNRWLGRPATDEELITYTLERMDDVPEESRGASLQTCLCFYNPNTETLIQQTDKIEGVIPVRPCEKRTPGFPFRPLLVIPRFDRCYEELTDDEKKEVDQRLIALDNISPKITEYLVQ